MAPASVAAFKSEGRKECREREPAPFVKEMKRGIDITQIDSYDCGAACLCSIAAWWGKRVSLTRARLLCGCTQNGITVRGIENGARELGMEAKGIKAIDKNVSDLKHIASPFIAHTLNDEGMLHYLAVYNVAEDKITVMDPALGCRKSLAAADFARIWTGIAITLRPGISFKASDSNDASIFRQMLRYGMEHFKEIILLVSLGLSLSMLGIADSLILQYLIDIVIPGGDWALMASVSALVMAIFMLQLLLSLANNRFFVKAMTNMDTGILSRYSRNLLCLSLFKTSQFNAGDLTSRIADIPKIRKLFSDTLVSLFVSFITLCTAMCIVFSYSRVFGMVLLAFIPLYGILYKYTDRINRKYSHLLAGGMSVFHSRFVNYMTDRSGVGHFCMGSTASAHLNADFSSIAGNMRREGNVNAILALFSQLLARGITITVIIAGAVMVSRGELSMGCLVSMYTLCWFITGPLENTVELSSEVAQAGVSWRRVFEIINLEQGKSDGTEFGRSLFRGDIVFENVRFEYIGRLPLWTRLNIRLSPGVMNVISGPNGCGKSTLASLLVKDYLPIEGRITIGEVDIQAIDESFLKKNVLVLSGTDSLWIGSLIDNVCCFAGQTDRIIGRAVQIMESVGLGELIRRLPQNVLTNVGGPAGEALSNGERQKVLLARALYADPQILVLDEAASALDESTRKLIWALLRNRCRQGKTVVMITHDCSLAVEEDRVLHLDKMNICANQ